MLIDNLMSPTGSITDDGNRLREELERITRLLAKDFAFHVTIDRTLPGGARGAYVHLRGGQRCVLKYYGPADAAVLRTAFARVERLRQRGYLAASHWPVFVLSGDVVAIQEAVRGRNAEGLSHKVVDRLIWLNGLQADDAGDDDSWSRFITVSLLAGGPRSSAPLHEPLRRHSLAARALLTRIVSIGAAVQHIDLPGTDAVHYDFQHNNLLVEDGAVTAVIDWDDSRTGDRFYDLVTLAFVSSVARNEKGAERRIWRHVTEHRDAAVVAAYVAHVALRWVDHYIRWHPANADAWLEIAHRHLDTYA